MKLMLILSAENISDNIIVGSVLILFPKIILKSQTIQFKIKDRVKYSEGQNRAYVMRVRRMAGEQLPPVPSYHSSLTMMLIIRRPGMWRRTKMMIKVNL